jgi:hypothetical protein
MKITYNELKLLIKHEIQALQELHTKIDLDIAGFDKGLSEVEVKDLEFVLERMKEVENLKEMYKNIKSR